MQFTEIALPFILEEINREKPDFIICDHLAIWGKIALKKVDIKACFFYSNVIYRAEDKQVDSWTLFKEYFKGFTVNLPYVLDTARIVFGIGKKYGDAVWKPKEIFDNEHDFNIVMNSRKFQPKGDTYGDNYHFIGPGEFATQDFDKKREVIFIFRGTIESDIPFWSICFEALKDIGYPVIISLGGTNDPGFSQQEIPDNFQLVHNLNKEQYIEVLKKAALFISHGGVNSVCESITYLTPLVIIPNAFQNYPPGIRAKQLGIAEYFHRNHLSVKRLRESCQKVLSQDSYMQNIEQCRTSFQETMPLRESIIDHMNQEFQLF